LIGIDYGDEFPWDTIAPSETILMTDFSLQPFSDMVRLEKACYLVWIDHHKSAIEEATKVNFSAAGLLEIGTGACILTYRYLFRPTTIPTFVRLLGEYDVWDHSDPRTLPFQYGMRLLDTDPNNKEMWDGSIVLKYVTQYYNKYAESCVLETEIVGHKCLAINLMLANSQLFDSVWDNKEYDIMVAFGWRGGKWNVSLYTDKDGVDVSVIAKSFGGGGHKQAAGFQCEELPFALK